jgi:DNA-directed RNA polymerase specialized sigma24 family protein
MNHVDPASTDFEALPPQGQAFIYRHQLHWTIESIADEFDVSESTVKRWLSPSLAERHRKQERLRMRRLRAAA